MKNTLVNRWFGPQFRQLHPLLQQLHEEGGCLAGEVELGVGPGISGWVGRRLARKLGLPAQAGRMPLTVDISHTHEALVWGRRFSAGHPMVSRFEPVGQWPDGYWLERTGAMQFRLTVDVKEGGWHWRVLGASLHGIPLPVKLMPQSHAYKCMEGEDYRFDVAFTAPMLGPLLWYRGLLQLQPRGTRPEIGTSSPADSPRP
jgi:hypothetical protein